MRVALHASNSWGRWAHLRPLTGHDELALDPRLSRGGRWLLERLLMDAPGAAVGPADVDRLDISDRDRLLAAVFDVAFGDRVDGVTRCGQCGADYEFNFALSALTEHQTPSRTGAIEGPDESGFYLVRGVRFRLPTMADLDAVRAAPPDEAALALLRRCVDAQASAADEDVIEQAMEQLAPSLDLEIASTCPHCKASGVIDFSLEKFLLQALAGERRFLSMEIHLLASAYGWTLADILSLSRDDRRTLVRCVERERWAGSG